jgi:GT2 family glycosyltransferase
MKFSVLLNSRERPEMLVSLIESLYRTCKEPNEIEVLIGGDMDDRTLDAPSSVIPQHYNLVRFFRREREPNLHTYLNFLYGQSEGQYIFVLNDDCVMETPNWDSIIYNKMEYYASSFPDRIMYGKVIDNSTDRVNQDYAAFPIFSREAVEALGYVMPERFPMWGADVAIYRIYAAIGRIVDLTDVKINHVLHSNGLPGDHLRAEMMEVFLEHPKDYFSYDITDEVNKLRLALEESVRV